MPAPDDPRNPGDQSPISVRSLPPTRQSDPPPASVRVPRNLPSADSPPPSVRAPRNLPSADSPPPSVRNLRHLPPTDSPPPSVRAPRNLPSTDFPPPSARAPRNLPPADSPPPSVRSVFWGAYSPDSPPPPGRPTPRSFPSPVAALTAARLNPSSVWGPSLERELPAPPPAAEYVPFDTLLARTLSRYLSELNGAAILAACSKTCGMRRDQLGPQHVPQIVAQVEASFDFFGVDEVRRRDCLAQLRALAMEPQGARVEPTVIVVEREGDIVRARLAGKLICQKLGFSDVNTAKIVTAISELSRNIVQYATRGSITLRSTGGEPGALEIIATDRGPGIADVDAVLRPGYRSRTGMGAGLRGTRSIMDYFEIRSRPGEGTTVTIRKLKS